MLAEIGITNLAIIEELRIQLAPGFNVLTGETGAGKSIIIDAVNCILGSRAEADMIRTGADCAYIEGTFYIEPPLADKLEPLLQEHGFELEDGVLILTRQINSSGRHVCRVNGRASTLAALRDIAQHLVDIHGQGDNLSLLRVRQHVEFLDRYAGLGGLRAEFAQAVAALQRTRQELRGLLRDEREMAQRVDLLEYQISEIAAADPRPGEEETLLQERNRLANAERLIRLAATAYGSLNEGLGEGPSLLDALNRIVRHVLDLERLDPSTAQTREMVEQSIVLLEEASSALRDYRDELEYDPGRLGRVEDRIELLHTLKRKYGDSIDEILAYQAKAAQELDDITHHEERIQELEEQEAGLLQELGEIGERLSQARRQAAQRLEKEIEAQLHDLRMANARFLVDLRREEDPQGAIVGDKRYRFDASGLDQVEFLIAPNVGEEPKPLATTASGGETSRLMLAMKSVLSAADEIPTLIFDEIDAGIGGRIGSIVGQKLWALAANHQVLCVTHLPQMAAFGDVHYRVAKAVRQGRTVTIVEKLAGQERLAEMASMLGDPDSQMALSNAQEMLSAPRPSPTRPRRARASAQYPPSAQNCSAAGKSPGYPQCHPRSGPPAGPGPHSGCERGNSPQCQ